MSELRKIIVNATSEMLDEPDENGIYKTSRFYDRLESEVNEYIQLHPGPINIYDLIMETVKNSQHLTPTMQNMVARYLDYQSAPRMVVKGEMPNKVADTLFGKGKIQ